MNAANNSNCRRVAARTTLGIASAAEKSSAEILAVK
jgi:hypothetical protein